MIRAIRRNLTRSQDGSVLIEFALVAPVLALLTVGVIDLSNAFGRKLALEQGAQRAIEKIMQTTEFDTVEGTLKTEAVCQVNGVDGNGNCKGSPITTNDVTVTYRLQCMSGTTVSSNQTSTDSTAFDAMTCNTGQKERRYIEVRVDAKYTPLFPIRFSGYSYADNAYPISATAGMRTQ